MLTLHEVNGEMFWRHILLHLSFLTIKINKLTKISEKRTAQCHINLNSAFSKPFYL